MALASWLGVGEEMPPEGIGSVCRGGSDVAASDKDSLSLEESSRIGEGNEAEIGGN